MRASRALPRLSCIALLTASAWLVHCAPPPAPQGPRSTGASSRAFVDGAELELRYRYESTSVAEFTLLIDAKASAGSVGAVVIEVVPEGCEPLDGSARWTRSIADGQTETLRTTLRVLDTATPRVTVVTTRSDGGAELGRDTLRFIVAETAVRECQPTDAACGN